MKNISKTVFLVLIALGFVLLLWFLVKDHTIAILEPRGMIAHQERHLIVVASILMAVIVVPVLILTILISVRYRAGNTRAKYTPNWEHSTIQELIWWALPCVIILALAIITWKSTYELDPFRPIPSSTRAIKIQVIAMQWKWLFIYSEQGIATVNFIALPINTPIDFEITSDAPMNSFWIPQLGGQIYAMSGMATKLHLIADRVGSYAGSSANFSGEGFSGMKFEARAVSQSDFDQWVHEVQQSSPALDMHTYTVLASPSTNNPVTYYSSADPHLFNDIISKFMTPESTMHHHGN